jgi:hypothetical protein
MIVHMPFVKNWSDIRQWIRRQWILLVGSSWCCGNIFQQLIEVNVNAAALVLQVSLNYFYKTSTRTGRPRLEEWGISKKDSSKELPQCCRDSKRTCIRYDTLFRTATLLGDKACCSSSKQNALGSCKLRTLLAKNPGLVQDWHDQFNIKHGAARKTWDEQRTIILELLVHGVCRNGIRLVLNTQISNERISAVLKWTQDNGNNFQSLIR